MNRPNPLEKYLGLEPLPLAPDPPEFEVAAVDALASPAEPAPGALSLESLARLPRWGESAGQAGLVARG